MNRATHPSDPHLQVKSVIGRCSIPGRVFVEVHDETNARSFAMSIAELNPNAVRIVPVEEMLSVLYIKNPFSFDDMNWARLTGRGAGWRIYKGDIAMVIPQNGVKLLLVIPRIKTADSVNSPKPQQSLFPAHVLANLFGAACISSISPDGSFSFQGKRMTKEGFLYQNVSEVDVFRPGDDLPTVLELETFKACSFMDDKILNEANSRLSRLKVALDARVVVVEGDYKGLVGRVIEIGENEAAVDVETQDHIERVHLSSVKMAFRLGDQVQITQGPHSGRTGWIVDVQDHVVTVINVEHRIEVILHSCYRYVVNNGM
jgi:ribosomal protein L24